MTAPDLHDLTCPGCHFRCPLDRYQCGRGRAFAERAAAGEELPAWRPPMMRAPGEAGPQMPLDERLAREIAIAGMVLRDRTDEPPEHRIAGALAHAEGFMAPGVLGQRARLEQPELDRVLCAMADDGLLAFEDDAWGEGYVVLFTEAGEAAARTWQAEHDEAMAAFFAPLDDDAKERLADALHRLLAAHMPRR